MLEQETSDNDKKEQLLKIDLHKMQEKLQWINTISSKRKKEKSERNRNKKIVTEINRFLEEFKSFINRKGKKRNRRGRKNIIIHFL